MNCAVGTCVTDGCGWCDWVTVDTVRCPDPVHRQDAVQQSGAGARGHDGRDLQGHHRSSLPRRVVVMGDCWYGGSCAVIPSGYALPVPCGRCSGLNVVIAVRGAGFQRVDFTTDLRGAGLLGPLQMLYFLGTWLVASRGTPSSLPELK